ncbi:unnamed protein product, partial [Meganyctiphanes norvegica]
VSGPLWCLLLLATACLILPDATDARSTQYRYSSLRRKRVSDQRLAELETLLALAKINHRKYFSQPVGFGLIDVDQIGRRKRRTSADSAPTLSSRNGNSQQLDYNIQYQNQYRDVPNLMEEIASSPWSSENLAGDTAYSQMPQRMQQHHKMPQSSLDNTPQGYQVSSNENLDSDLLETLHGPQQRVDHMALQGGPHQVGDQMTQQASSSDDSLDQLQYHMLI